MEEFWQLEYKTLRKEIEESKHRLFLIVASGVSISTAADFAALSCSGNILGLLLPSVVIAFALLFLAQNNAKFRAGKYIKEHIESRLEGGAKGWEHWLDDNHDEHHRMADKYLRCGFFLVFLTYYSFATYLAGMSLNSYKYWVWILFGLLGGIFAFFFRKNCECGND